MGSIERGGSQVSRRDFLKFCGCFGSTVAGCLLTGYSGWLIKREWVDVLSSSPAVPLRQTAVALEQLALDNSFQEKGGFTREMFERARKGTVIVEVDQDNEGVPAVFQGTGYIIGHQNDTIQLLTTKHIFQGEEVKEIRLFRPHIDTKYFVPSSFSIHKTKGDDLDLDFAIVECRGQYDTNIPFESIKYATNQDLTNREILVVGFPGVFLKADNLFATNTLGSVMEIIEPSDSPGYWWADGASSPGSSGSPVFIKQKEELKLVGLVTGSRLSDTFPEIATGQMNWHTIVRRLD